MSPRAPMKQSFLRFATSLTGFSVIAAELSRLGAESSSRAADLGLTLLLVVLLPLSLTFSLLSFEPEPGGLEVVLGRNRKRMVFRSWLWLAAGVALFTVLAAGIVLLRTRTTSDPKLGQDLATTLPIAAGAAVASFSLFLAIRAWSGKIGLGIVLLFTWTLGQSDVAASAALPSGHVRHLLGVGEPLGMSPSLSAGCLAAFCLVSLLLLLRRIPS